MGSRLSSWVASQPPLAPASTISMTGMRNGHPLPFEAVDAPARRYGWFAVSLRRARRSRCRYSRHLAGWRTLLRLNVSNDYLARSCGRRNVHGTTANPPSAMITRPLSG
jgi:hypothetical protein